MAKGEFDGYVESAFELVHPEDQARVRATVLAALDNREVYECDFRVVRPDGAVRWVTIRGRAYVDGGDQPLRLIGTIIDISYRKEAELQLLDADRRKNEFLATLRMNYEIRSPRFATRCRFSCSADSRFPTCNGPPT